MDFAGTSESPRGTLQRAPCHSPDNPDNGRFFTRCRAHAPRDKKIFGFVLYGCPQYAL